MAVIPFNRPAVVGKELDYIAEAVQGHHLAGDGEFTRRCHQWIEERFRARQALLTHSCTAALEMSAILSGVEPGDEVIMPSFTFVSTANAFVLRGGIPVFVDIRPDTLNIDETKIEQAITDRTKVIVPVHYAGVSAEMDAILEIASRHDLVVVEDAADGVNATYKGRYLGTLGHLGAYSFHETKSFISGEGGAVLVNDERFAERAEIIREKGTNRSQFFRGEVESYTWLDVGSSYLPSDLVAAFLLAQLEEWEVVQANWKRIWRTYRDNLQDWAQENGVGLPFIPSHCGQPYRIFYLLLPSRRHRQALIGHLRVRGIEAVFHYLPLHLSAMGRRFGARPGDCPVTESTSECLLRLPIYHDLTEDEQRRVVEAILDSS